MPSAQSKTGQPNCPKKKVTYYLSEEVYGILNEIYAKRVSKKGKVDYSVIVSEAIELLYYTEKMPV